MRGAKVSEANLAAAERMHLAYARGDVGEALAVTDAAVEVIAFPEMSDAPYVGHDGIRRLFADREEWDTLEFEADEFRGNGECVAILGRLRARRGGALTDYSAGIVMTFRNEKIVRVESFTGVEQALRACGLDSEPEAAAAV
jgi:ketosteroid isomerase-like protein